MKTLTLLLALSFSPAAFAAIQFKVDKPQPVSDEVVLHFIAIKESGNNPQARGSHGERSQFQFMANTWRRYSRLPHSAAATNLEESDRVAHAYLADIRANLRKRGLPETAYFIAASWHAGINWKRTSAGVRDYAQSVENLVMAAEIENRSNLPGEAVLAAPTQG